MNSFEVGQTRRRRSRGFEPRQPDQPAVRHGAQKEAAATQKPQCVCESAHFLGTPRAPSMTIFNTRIQYHFQGPESLNPDHVFVSVNPLCIKSHSLTVTTESQHNTDSTGWFNLGLDFEFLDLKFPPPLKYSSLIEKKVLTIVIVLILSKSVYLLFKCIN